MAVKNRQAHTTYTDDALATTPAEDLIHGTPTLTYDYSQLDPQLAAVAQTKALAMKRAERRTVENMVQIGRDLQELQASFPHGLFLPWLTEEFGWSRALAYKLINLAERLPPDTPLPAIGLTALYQLTSTSVPQSALDEAAARAANGETITITVAKTIATKHKIRNAPAPTAQAPHHATADDTDPNQAPYIDLAPGPPPHTPQALLYHLRRALPHLLDARNRSAGSPTAQQIEIVLNQFYQIITRLEQEAEE